jgi:hypothetical protein
MLGAPQGANVAAENVVKSGRFAEGERGLGHERDTNEQESASEICPFFLAPLDGFYDPASVIFLFPWWRVFVLLASSFLSA